MTSATAPASGLKDDFSDLVNLLDSLTHTNNDLNALTTALNVIYLEEVRQHAEPYKALQKNKGEIVAALEVIAARNPQWFEEKKTLETPFGQVKRTTSIALTIPDEAVSITLIQAAGRAKDFLEVTTSIRREVIEALEDAELAKFGISRTTTHNFKPEAASVDLGKSVKQAEKSAAAAKKTAKKVGDGGAS